MAFSAITQRGSVTAQAGASTIAMSPSADLTVGKLVVVTVHTDNLGTADGTSTDHSSVADNASGSQNVWRKATEKTDTDGVADDGAVVSVWYSVLKTQIATTDTITCTLAGSITARAITCTEATITDNAVEVEDVGTGQGSITAASAALNSREYLFLYAASSEGNDTTKGIATNYVEQHDFRTGNTGAVNISGYVQTRIQTTTSSGSVAPSGWTTNITNPISVIVAFREARTLEMPVGDLGVTGLVGSLALTIGMALGSLGLTGLAPTATVAEAGVEIQIPAGSLDLTGKHYSIEFAWPGPGSLDLTGLAPTVSVESGTTIPIPVGALDLTGLTPVVGRGVGVPAGTLDLPGLAPALLHVLPVPVGSLDLTGLAATMNVGQSIGVDVGSVDLTGLAPALLFSSAIPAGTLDLTGLTAQPYVGLTIAPGLGTIDLTGLAPSLAHGLTIPVGSLDLTGYAPALFGTTAIPVGTLDLAGTSPVLGLTIPIGAGSLDLTGLEPTVNIQAPGETNIPIPVGTLDLTGLAPSLAFSIAIPAGTIDLTGLAPSASQGIQISVGVGSLDMAGLAPTLLLSIAVPVGSVDLTGTAPSLLDGLAVQAGTVDLVGLAPSVQIGVVLAIPVGTLDLTGLAVTLAVADGQINVPVGSLDLTGLAPTLVFEGNIRLELSVVTYQITSQSTVDLQTVMPTSTGSSQITSTSIGEWN